VADFDHTRTWQEIEDAVADARVPEVDVVVILVSMAEDMVQSLINYAHFDRMEGKKDTADFEELRQAVSAFSEQCANLVQPCFAGSRWPKSNRNDDERKVM
jgi:hypothetical protein